MRERLRVLALRARSRRRAVIARSANVAAGVRVTVAPGARVVIEPGATLGPDSRIEAVGGTVRIGSEARLGERAVVVSHVGVTIGPRAGLGAWAAVIDGGPTWAEVERPVRGQPLAAKPVLVGAGARIGAHAVIGPGVEIAAGATVEPYAVLPAPPKRPAAISDRVPRAPRRP